MEFTSQGGVPAGGLQCSVRGTHCESGQDVGSQPHSNPHKVGHPKVLHHTVDLLSLFCHSWVAEEERPRACSPGHKGIPVHLADKGEIPCSASIQKGRSPVQLSDKRGDPLFRAMCSSAARALSNNLNCVTCR